jgi:hypothetical protein
MDVINEMGIKAVVSIEREKVGEGGAPIFYADDVQEQKQLSFLLEKILDATAHDLKNGVMILVKH